MTVHLRVLTLNCWGVPTRFACKYRAERMEAIGREIGKGEYDIVLLQEIWLQADFKTLCSYITHMMPHVHYYHSGMIGAGLCIFSKFPILETFQHNFTLNGYAHKVKHGDWFCDKSVGLAKMLVNDFRINVYITHTHAEYRRSGLYGAHRIAQAYELSQFVKLTSETCDAVILGGDFNFQPADLGYKMIKCNANLKDSWIDQRDQPGHVGTSGCPGNSYRGGGSKDGQCLDFLMFRNNAGCDLVCDKCSLTMRQIPELGYSYSDHEGVMANFTIKRNPTAMAVSRDDEAVREHFAEALPRLDDGMKKARADQRLYGILIVVGLILLALTGTLELSVPGMSVVIILAKVGLILATAFCFWSSVVLTNTELTRLSAARKDITNLLRSNSI